jgi:hypothetical protein
MLESESTLPLRIYRPCLRKTQTATFWGLFLAPHCATLRLKALEIVTTRDYNQHVTFRVPYLIPPFIPPAFDIHAPTQLPRKFLFRASSPRRSDENHSQSLIPQIFFFMQVFGNWNFPSRLQKSCSVMAVSTFRTVPAEFSSSTLKGRRHQIKASDENKVIVVIPSFSHSCNICNQAFSPATYVIAGELSRCPLGS